MIPEHRTGSQPQHRCGPSLCILCPFPRKLCFCGTMAWLPQDPGVGGSEGFLGGGGGGRRWMAPETKLPSCGPWVGRESGWTGWAGRTCLLYLQPPPSSQRLHLSPFLPFERFCLTLANILAQNLQEPSGTHPTSGQAIPVRSSAPFWEQQLGSPPQGLHSVGPGSSQSKCFSLSDQQGCEAWPFCSLLLVGGQTSNSSPALPCSFQLFPPNVPSLISGFASWYMVSFCGPSGYLGPVVPTSL